MEGIKVFLAERVQTGDTSARVKSSDLTSVGFASPTYVVSPKNKEDLPLLLKTIASAKLLTMTKSTLYVHFSFNGEVAQSSTNPLSFNVSSAEIGKTDLKDLLLRSTETTLCTNNKISVTLEFACEIEATGFSDPMETVVSDR